MLELIVVAVVGLLGFYSGWKTREEVAARIVNGMLSELQDDEENDGNTIKISIEQHSGVYYVYDCINNTFMAQGGSRKEVETILVKNFPGKTFIAEHKNLLEVGFIS